MTPDSTLVSSGLNSTKDWLDWIIIAFKILGGGGIFGIFTMFITKILPWYKNRNIQNILKKRVGADLYSEGVIEQATRYYIQPNCQSLDPAGSEEPRLVYGAKQNLFDAVDDALNHPTEYRYIILLADSGMGKTSFLLNYYDRAMRKKNITRFVLLPLGIPDVDERISGIQDKKNTILFLDALDEDTLAIVDHAERLKHLVNMTRDFTKILITCRTQFFPKDEEIPKETGIIKIGPRPAGEKAQYHFHKLYISPFTNKQVDAYLKKRYPFGRKNKRQKAHEMIQKIPDLCVRPMLLAHIDDLVGIDKTFKYSFQLYEEMVEAWLVREEGIVEGVEKEPLRQFSELLAIDLFIRREQRGAERINKNELAEFAGQFNISLDDWQLTGRSLLNRDAVGNYKFAHRSIMEYLFVKRFLELEPEARTPVKWTDLMKQFVKEILIYRKEHDIPVPNLAYVNIDLAELQLRASGTALSDAEVREMLIKFDFFDKHEHKNGKGIQHIYVTEERNGDRIILDLATNLIWLGSGSSDSMEFKNAKKWIKELNRKGYAGYNDWRLPTLEEAMSLMEPEEKNADLYIDPVFDKKQWWIWTADMVKGVRWAWVVYFSLGKCYYYLLSSNYYVRAVRSGLSSVE